MAEHYAKRQEYDMPAQAAWFKRRAKDSGWGDVDEMLRRTTDDSGAVA